mmetsp:Transcript_67258/g.101388  ORF Transcript_67258/g.101388 Transcript_67258/m.101388 type:complete len:434 (-) Transcript_67258:159-1460(-)
MMLSSFQGSPTFRCLFSSCGKHFRTGTAKDNDNDNDNDNDKSLQDIEALRYETQTTTTRKRSRVRVFTYSFLLCLSGIVALQCFNVYEFRPMLEDRNKRGVQKPATRQFEQDYFAPSINFRTRGRSQYEEDLKLMHDACLDPARDLEWEWFTPAAASTTLEPASYEPSHSTTTNNTDSGIVTTNGSGTQKRLLIALYAGFDEYAHFLDHSAKIAKLYATLWGPRVTVVVLQGTAFAPRGCQPPGVHTTLNKIRLLFHAIDRTAEGSKTGPKQTQEGHVEGDQQTYDQLLLMDADTLLVNMTMDVTTLLSDKKHLLATGPTQHHKTKVPTGVTLWNLHHPDIRAVAMDWFTRSTEAVKRGAYQGDQEHLLVAPELYTERAEFATTGTVVRHYKKRDSADLQERQRGLSHKADRICKEYKTLCPDLEKKYESTNR